MKAFKGQDFAALRAQCRQQRGLFVDPTFPCDNNAQTPQWKRPTEICRDPKFVVDGFSRLDVNQGGLGDCWLLAALSSLTLHPKLIANVVPEDQSFGGDYAGIFHFRFWVDGEWTDVVIDDRLPCNANGTLVFVHSTAQNEFWIALFEKAYAKLRGSYGKLEGGLMSTAFENFTGGKAETYVANNVEKILLVLRGLAKLCGEEDFPLDYSPVPANFFGVLLRAHEKCSLICCGFKDDKPNNLKCFHAYSVTSVTEVANPNGGAKIPLLRIRNPWGHAEWKGRYSDSSPEWNKISEGERQRLGLVVKEDGEFWMHYDDLLRCLVGVQIYHWEQNANYVQVHSAPAHYQEQEVKGWFTHNFNGAWANHVTAGGSKNFLATYATNPQYRLELENPDDEDGLCTVIVTLTPKTKTNLRRNLGFDVYDMKGYVGAPRPLPFDFFSTRTPTVCYQSAEHNGSYTARVRLFPGTYCIVPHVSSSNEDGNFLLRIFTEKKSYVQDYDQEIDYEPKQIKPQVFIDMETDIVIPKTKSIEVDEDKRIREVFLRLAGVDQEIDYAILQTILNDLVGRDFPYKFNGFSSDVCRSLIATMDTDVSGKLGFDEFMLLMKNVQLWKYAFKTFDKDGSGLLNTNELRAALNLTGYSVNRNILKILVYRYAKNGEMNIDDFILCAVKLKTMIECFKSLDPKSTGLANLSKEDFVGHAMYS